MQCCSAYSSWRRLMHLLRRGAPPALPLARRRRRALPATRPVPLWCDAAAGSVREPLKSGLLAGQRASALCTCTLVPDFPVCSIMRLLHACWAARTITSLVAAGSSRSSLLTATRGSEGPMPVARLQECGIMMTQLQPNAAGPVPSDGCTLLLCCAVLLCAVQRQRCAVLAAAACIMISSSHQLLACHLALCPPVVGQPMQWGSSHCQPCAWALPAQPAQRQCTPRGGRHEDEAMPVPSCMQPYGSCPAHLPCADA